MGKGNKSRGSQKSSKTFKNQKNYHKKSAYKKPNRYLMVKKQIERNKESEDILKRQQLGKFSSICSKMITLKIVSIFSRIKIPKKEGNQ